MKSENESIVSYAIFDEATWVDRRLRDQFASAGMIPLCGRSERIGEIVSAVPEQYAAFLILDGKNRIGMSGYDWMMARAAELRALTSTVGLIFIAETSFAVRADALPGMTWVLRRDEINLDILREIVILKKIEVISAYRDAFYEMPSDGRSRGPNIAGSMRSTAPNYNIKHLSMLVPLALAARNSGREVFCEISPQEALTYCRVSSQADTRKMVEEGIGAVRLAVNQVNLALGSNLKLHLDHCDDLHIIEHAAEIGFDSIMADGSARSLEQNIVFVRRAEAILSGRPISLEGEVGNIDGHGLRRWSHTRGGDLKRFLSETNVDYVGVHVGQFHGFSYDYQRSRKHHVLIRESRKAACVNDWGAFINACKREDEFLGSLGVSRSSDERKVLLHCVRLALDGRPSAPATVKSLFELVEKNVPYRIQPLLSRLEQAWLEFRLEDVRRRNFMWQEIFEGKAVDRKAGVARVDWSLMGELFSISSDCGACLVMHGGSSVSDDDLAMMNGYGVARVNFGTQVFHDYLVHLAAEQSIDASSQIASHLGAMNFLDEYAGKWRDWLDEPPASVVAFAERVIEKHIRTLGGDGILANEYAYGKGGGLVGVQEVEGV